MSSTYFTDLKTMLSRKKELLYRGLANEFHTVEPHGGYFIVASPKEKLYKKLDSSSTFDRSSDSVLAENLIINHGIGSIPMSAFYSVDKPRESWLRFAYCKQETLIKQGMKKLEQLS
jgi:aspartate/methionine/tyrosine aminotransferase